jgi:hypothetical protein
MKMKTETFLDDKPVFDWNDLDYGRYYRNGVNTKARFCQPHRPKAKEVAVAGLVGLAAFAFVFVCIVLAFVAL